MFFNTVEGYHNTCGEISSVPWGDIVFCYLSTVVGYHDTWEDIMSTVEEVTRYFVPGVCYTFYNLNSLFFRYFTKFKEV